MKVLAGFFVTTFVIIHSCIAAAEPKSGFYLPETICEATLTYRDESGLIVLPVTINNTIHVNLILDTGCRNLILFGKRFEKLFNVQPGRKVEFSGLGDGNPIAGTLALNNKVAIDAVLGEQIPIVLVPTRNLFSRYPNVHGVIGYEVFSRFEIELNPRTKTISFRPGDIAELPKDYARVSLRVVDSRPIMTGVVDFVSDGSRPIDLMIDTGSTLGLLIKSNKDDLSQDQATIIGRGLNGPLKAIQKKSRSLIFPTISLSIETADIIHSHWSNLSSIGMNVLREYSLILNYSKAYAGFKKIS